MEIIRYNDNVIIPYNDFENSKKEVSVVIDFLLNLKAIIVAFKK